MQILLPGISIIHCDNLLSIIYKDPCQDKTLNHKNICEDSDKKQGLKVESQKLLCRTCFESSLFIHERNIIVVPNLTLNLIISIKLP